MALKTFKCRCGTEFEDSEFGVLDECEDCRQVPAPANIGVNTDVHELLRNMHLDLMNATAFNPNYRVVTTTNMPWNLEPTLTVTDPNYYELYEPF